MLLLVQHAPNLAYDYLTIGAVYFDGGFDLHSGDLGLFLYLA